MDNKNGLITSIPVATIRDLDKEIKGALDRCGLFYKLFSRIKDPRSIKKKLDQKIVDNMPLKYKMQDMVGFRIVLYFKEDIDVCENIIEKIFKVLNTSKDQENTTAFGPCRKNYVCQIEEKHNVDIDFENILDGHIDKTFEIQLRTVFSEGWHEIDHDFRYKSKDVWEKHENSSRTLNGILATLETCDWAITSLFDTMAYGFYQEKKWEEMLKHKLRIRFIDDQPSKMISFLNNDTDLAKLFYRVDRGQFLLALSNCMGPIELTLTNVIWLINIYQVNNDEIFKETNPAIVALSKSKY